MRRRTSRTRDQRIPARRHESSLLTTTASGSGVHTLGTYATPEEAEAMRVGGLKARTEIGLGVTLEQWGEEWLKIIAGQKAIRSVRSLWRTIIADAPFYREPLDTLRQTEIEEWVATLPKKRCKRSVLRDGKRATEEIDRTLSQQMIKHALRKLQLCLDAAKKKGLVSDNVARRVELPERERIEDTWTHLERSEIDAVFKLELTEEQRAVFSVAIFLCSPLPRRSAARRIPNPSNHSATPPDRNFKPVHDPVHRT